MRCNCTILTCKYRALKVILIKLSIKILAVRTNEKKHFKNRNLRKGCSTEIKFYFPIKIGKLLIRGDL